MMSYTDNLLAFLIIISCNNLIAFCMQELVCSVAALHNGVFSYRKLKITAALSSVTARFSPKLFSSWILDSSSVSWLDMLRGDTGGTPLPPARHSLYCSVGRKQVSGLVRLYMGNRYVLHYMTITKFSTKSTLSINVEKEFD